MTRHLVYVAVAVVCGLSSNVALAEIRRMAQAPKTLSFDELDKNHDAKLSLDEASADDKLFVAFKTLDKNKDGYLSREEFAAHRQTQ